MTAPRPPERAPRRIVFGLTGRAALESVRALAAALKARGLSVHLAFDDAPPHDAAQSLLDACPNLTVGRAPGRSDAWADFTRQLRLDGRAETFARAPADPGVVAALRQLDADLYVTTAPEDPSSTQADYLLAAQTLGVPSLWLPLDWTRDKPLAQVDAAVAWNADHARDLAAAGVPADEIRIVGAPAFDAWFETRTTTSRRKVLERLEARDLSAYVVYAAATTEAVDRIEPRAFLQWLEALRASPDQRLAALTVLVRPDVIDGDAWRDLALSDPRLVRLSAGSLTEPGMSDKWYAYALAFASGVVTTMPTVALQAAMAGLRPVLLPSEGGAAMRAASQACRRLFDDGLVIEAEDLHGLKALGAVLEPTPPERPRDPPPALVRFLRPIAPETPALTQLVEAVVHGVAAPAARAEKAPLDLSLALLRYQAGVEFVQQARERRRFDDPSSPRVEGAAARFGDAFARRVWPAAVAAARHLWPATRPFSGRLLDTQLNPDEQRRFARAEAAVAEALAGDCPIVVGPCLMPVSLEIGYWLPFLRWLRRHYQVGARRVIVLGRGGTSAWYEGIGDRYVDLLDVISPTEYRTHLATLAGQHRGRSPVERALELRLAQQASARLGVRRFNLLSPSLIFDLFDMTGQDLPGRVLAEHFTRFDVLRPNPGAARRVRKSLPKRYIAVKFHANAMLAETKANRAFVEHLAHRLSERHPVVALGSHDTLDGARDFVIPRGERIIRIDPMQDPAHNLEHQAAVLGGAEMVFATYGGIGLTAAAMGQRVFMLADRDATAPPWMDLAERACAAWAPRASRLNIDDMPVLDWVVPRYAPKTPPPGPDGDQ